MIPWYRLELTGAYQKTKRFDFATKKREAAHVKNAQLHRVCGAAVHNHCAAGLSCQDYPTRAQAFGERYSERCF